jgi:hypothetical protein
VSEGQQDLGISSILENTGNNGSDILEYCTPNYATNTSKLFSTKGNKNIVHVNSKGKNSEPPVQMYGYGKLFPNITYFIDQLDSITSHYDSRKESEQLSKAYTITKFDYS